MSGQLLDTNVLSELRKGSRASARVREWFDRQSGEDLYVSVLTLGEIRRGIERIRRRDPKSAKALNRWLDWIKREYEARILPVDDSVADRWGRLDPARPVPPVDGLLAATALQHDLVLVTRNQADVASTGAVWFNPFSGEAST